MPGAEKDGRSLITHTMKIPPSVFSYTFLVLVGFLPDLARAEELRSAFDRIEAEAFQEQKGIVVSGCEDEGGGMAVGYIVQGDFLRFDNVDFGEGALGFEARVASLFDGAIIDIRIDSPNSEPIGRLVADGTGDWQNWETVATPIQEVSGVHTVYLTFGDLFNINWFRFTHDAIEPVPTIVGNLQATPALPEITRNTMPDTFEAVDAIGRVVPSSGVARSARKDRFVGVFYFLTQGDEDREIYDISRLLKENPESPKLGPVHKPHYWGEPYLGYYHTTDPFVIRKHAQMLSDAQVDVIVLDVSNGVTYPRLFRAVFEEFAKMRRQGLSTPQIAFHTGEDPDNCATTITKLYDFLYSKNYYPELWFRWQGRPLILANMVNVPAKIRDFFTDRRSWAWSAGSWFGDGKDAWTWIDHLPQAVGWHESPDKPEQISVAIAEHPIMGVGRSSTSSATPNQPMQAMPPVEVSGKGTFFNLQWERALEIDPEFIFITSWNEWVAGHYKTNPGQPVFFLDRILNTPGLSYFVDSYSLEFSRDAEPMRGGFEDNYYYQMVSNIRRFKGVRAVAKATGQKEITIDEPFAQWDGVGPEYLDDERDTSHRDFKGFGNANFYKNTSGRNDIVAAKVAEGDKSVAFFVRTAAPLTEPTANWMVLYLDTDKDLETGWSGFDYAINRTGPGLVEKFSKDSKWEPAGTAPIAFENCTLHLSVQKNLFTAAPGEGFRFKWADNSTPSGEIIEFTDQGDAAPNARFAWRFLPVFPERKSQ